MARRWLLVLLCASPACCLRVPRDEALAQAGDAPRESSQELTPAELTRVVGGSPLQQGAEDFSHCKGDIFQDAVWTCKKGAVWLVTEDKQRNIPAWIQENSPVCVQKLHPCNGKNFWIGRMEAVYRYLEKNPGVTHAIVTDDDVVVNPLWWSEILERFNSATDETVARASAKSAKNATKNATQPKPRVLISTEQTCWIGKLCEEAWATKWLQKVRRGTHNEDLTSFLNSQYMGERLGVMRLLEEMFATRLYDDQAALHDVVARYPDDFTIDYRERVFLSLARGLVPIADENAGKSTICNFGGSDTVKCEPHRWRMSWGACRLQSSRNLVSISDKDGKWMPPPLVIHLNSLAMKQARTGRDCKAVIARAENRTVEQLRSKTIMKRKQQLHGKTVVKGGR